MLTALLLRGWLLTATPMVPAEFGETGSAPHLRTGCRTLTGEVPVECSSAGRPGAGRRVARIAAELGAGGLLAAAAIIPGVGARLDNVRSPGAAIGTAVGSMLAGLGVLGAGQLLQGDGSLRWTLGTAAATGALSTALVAVGFDRDSEVLHAIAIGSFALPLVASIIAYEVTSSTDRRFKNQAPVQVVPALAPTRDMTGGTLGLAGIF